MWSGRSAHPENRNCSVIQRKMHLLPLIQLQADSRWKRRPVPNRRTRAVKILLQYALTRRSLAMDQANIIEFNKMQVWTDRLIRARIEEAPPGFSKPTFRQLQSADQKMSMELADQTRSGIQTTGTGRPVEAVFEAVINSTAVTCLMQPMPGASVKSQFGGGDKQDFRSEQVEAFTLQR